jgi:heme oxygenase
MHLRACAPTRLKFSIAQSPSWPSKEKSTAAAVSPNSKVRIELLTHPCLLFLLGAFQRSAGEGESGKSTIVKQMKNIYMSGWTSDELLKYRPNIISNIVQSAQAIVTAMRDLGIKYQNDELLVSVNFQRRMDGDVPPWAGCDCSH